MGYVFSYLHFRKFQPTKHLILLQNVDLVFESDGGKKETLKLSNGKLKQYMNNVWPILTSQKHILTFFIIIWAFNRINYMSW